MANFDELMYLNAIAALEEAEMANAIPPRIFHQRDDPFAAMSDNKFIRTYRLTKQMASNLIDIVEPHLPQPLRSSALDASVKVNLYVM